MTFIQVILLAFVVLAGILYTFAFRSKLAVRLVGLAFFSGGAVLILLPDLSTRVAKLLGVGRGADLLFYFSILGGLFGFLLLYSRSRRTDRRMTLLLRAIAIRDAQRLSSSRGAAV